MKKAILSSTVIFPIKSSGNLVIHPNHLNLLQFDSYSYLFYCSFQLFSFLIFSAYSKLPYSSTSTSWNNLIIDFDNYPLLFTSRNSFANFFQHAKVSDLLLLIYKFLIYHEDISNCISSSFCSIKSSTFTFVQILGFYLGTMEHPPLIINRYANTFLKIT